MIYLFTGPIRGGKTTALLTWLEDKKNVSGFLCPDVDGKRKLYDISAGKWYPFQVDDVAGDAHVRIGRFIFSQEGFKIAGRILNAALNQKRQLVIIDEIGNLELENGGFAIMLRKALRVHDSDEFKGDILLVVRDSCLKKVIDHFGIQSFKVIGLEHIRGDLPWRSMD